jgi:hypothetical protein
MANPLMALIDPVLDKIFPDKNKLLEAKQKLKELEQKGELAYLDAEVKIALSQAAINERDAQSQSKFQSWWRPAAGWVCVFGLIYPVGTALLSWVLQVLAWGMETDLSAFPVPPQIDTGYLITMLMGMLGLGVQRTYERHKRYTEWGK